ncbi:hypothetical protein DsansV1_C01g0003471 [Dioscorea sansibarensis]
MFDVFTKIYYRFGLFLFLFLLLHSRLAAPLEECLMAILVILQWHSDIYSIVFAEARSVVP